MIVVFFFVWFVVVSIVHGLLTRWLATRSWRKAFEAAVAANATLVSLMYVVLVLQSETLLNEWGLLASATVISIICAAIVVSVCRIEPVRDEIGWLLAKLAAIQGGTLAAGILFGVILVQLMWEPRGVIGKVSRVKSDMRSTATGLEAYFVDHNAYPTTAPLLMYAPEKSHNKLERAGGSNLSFPLNLTTPTGYLASLFMDPFAPSGIPFAYHGDANGWILISPGPDSEYEINPAVDYVTSISQPSLQLVVRFYDPTNGIESRGDIVRVRQ